MERDEAPVLLAVLRIGDTIGDSAGYSVVLRKRGNVVMGCDIHLHSEIKINGKWHHYSHPRIDRNYTLFARMADVRNDGSIEPISKPRGIPENATFTTKYDYKHDSGHSASWLSWQEIVALGEWFEQKQRERMKPGDFYSFEHNEVGYLFGNSWSLEYKEELPKGLEDARFVFWFDN